MKAPRPEPAEAAASARQRLLARGVISLVLMLMALSLTACGLMQSREDAAMEKLREEARGKNLVMVLLDAAGYGHFGYAGYDRDTTPNIDALAAKSLVFDTAYSEAASTGPSVYAMFTSSYPFLAERQGLKGIRDAPFRIGEKTGLMPAFLAPKFPRRLAYSANAWIGPEFGFDRGFTQFHEIYDNEAVPDSTEHLAARNVDAFKKDLQTWGDEPVFVYLHFLEPHSPYEPPEKYARKFDPAAMDSIDASSQSLLRYRFDPPSPHRQEMIRALYDGNLAYADSKVGEVIDALKQSGHWEDTVFLVIADHGEAFWEHGVYEHGHHIYDEFMRIPFIVHVPGASDLAGKHIKQPVSLVDLLPTYLDLLEITPPDSLKGDSLLPLIAGSTKAFETRKIFLRNTHRTVPEFGVRAGDYKWIYRVRESSYQLYDLAKGRGPIRGHGGDDLAKDPHEQHDLVAAGAVPPQIAPLRKEIGLWIATGTHRVEPVEKLDPKTEARLHAIGYF